MNSAKQISPPTIAGSSDARPRREWWRLPLLLALVLVAIVAARWSREPARDSEQRQIGPPLVAVDGKSVGLRIEFADGREREFGSVAWRPGMTVDDLMTSVSRLPGGIRYTVVGDGQMTMLASIDGTENEWGGGRFWLYRVNGTLADRSLAVYELQPGDRVLWTFSDKE